MFWICIVLQARMCILVRWKTFFKLIQPSLKHMWIFTSCFPHLTLVWLFCFCLTFQVIGVPDERLGEEVCVWVHLQPDATVTEEELRTFCSAQVTQVHDSCSSTDYSSNCFYVDDILRAMKSLFEFHFACGILSKVRWLKMSRNTLHRPYFVFVYRNHPWILMSQFLFIKNWLIVVENTPYLLIRFISIIVCLLLDGLL